MGRRRNRGRAVDGVFLLNKPPGISSNFALQQVRRLYGAAKGGHTGCHLNTVKRLLVLLKYVMYLKRLRSALLLVVW